eukprot:9814829-Alexandrium_andersonii.AAC.1
MKDLLVKFGDSHLLTQFTEKYEQDRSQKVELRTAAVYRRKVGQVSAYLNACEEKVAATAKRLEEAKETVKEIEEAHAEHLKQLERAKNMKARTYE